MAGIRLEEEGRASAGLSTISCRQACTDLSDHIGGQSADGTIGTSVNELRPVPLGWKADNNRAERG